MEPFVQRFLIILLLVESFGSTEGSSSDFTDDLADFYDYPSYDDEDENGEMGSGGLPPPPPRPPPTPNGDNFFDGGTGSQGGKDKLKETSPAIIAPKVSNPKKLPGKGPSSWYEDGLEGDGGVCACNTTEILLKLPETLRGLPGAKGDIGMTGPLGPSGAQGPEGRQGIRGEKGERGDLGARGPEGIQGPKGEPGVIGPPGLQGRPGPPGPAGSPTFLGLDETYGGSGGGGGGVMARPGMPGPKGDRGEHGLMGPKGEKGSMGDKGERGQVGGRGEKGDRGHPGPKGDIGVPGIDGIPGTPGRDGKKGEGGPVGPPGPPGLPAISTGGGGSGGPGFTLDELLNTISVDSMKGDRGEPGQDGALGERGLPGLPGQKGDPGEPGPPGPAIQMDGSYATIRGEKGERGRRGKRGKPGPPGPPGEIGIPGWPGRAGSPGLAIQGPKGDKGEPAVLPENFFNYEVSGQRGLPGPPGPPGPPGLPGKPDVNEIDGSRPLYVPVPGPPGPKGDAGAPGLPGLSIVGEQGDIGPIGPSGPPGPPGQPSPGGSEGSKIVSGAVVFLSREGMLKMSEYTPLGTIAFVKDEESLFTRVSEGWKPILLGDLIRAPPVMAHAEMTTELPVFRPPFEAASLVNRVEGPSVRLAALNDPSTGDMRGVRGADYSCYRQARNSNLQGTFRAFLTSWVQNLDSIVKFSDRNLPVVNVKGDILFSSWTDIFEGGGRFVSKSPQIYSFNGRNVLQDFHWPQKKVWHGADSKGARTLQSDCEAWHTDAISNVGRASDLIAGELMGQDKVSCNHRLVVLCIEIASQHHYRRRRDVSEDATHSSPLHDHQVLLAKYSSRLHNLTLEEYTQFLHDYDHYLPPPPAPPQNHLKEEEELSSQSQSTEK